MSVPLRVEPREIVCGEAQIVKLTTMFCGLLLATFDITGTVAV